MRANAGNLAPAVASSGARREGRTAEDGRRLPVGERDPGPLLLRPVLRGGRIHMGKPQLRGDADADPGAVRQSQPARPKLEQASRCSPAVPGMVMETRACPESGPTLRRQLQPRVHEGPDHCSRLQLPRSSSCSERPRLGQRLEAQGLRSIAQRIARIGMRLDE